MRRLIPRSIIVASTLLLLAGCATRPQPQQPVAEIPAMPQPTPREPRLLLGQTAQTLVGQFGNPSLQVPEGSSLKLQFRTSRCVLDAYLYPQGGALRVAHVDTRTPSGAPADQATCVSELESRS